MTENDRGRVTTECELRELGCWVELFNRNRLYRIPRTQTVRTPLRSTNTGFISALRLRRVGPTSRIDSCAGIWVLTDLLRQVPTTAPNKICQSYSNYCFLKQMWKKQIYTYVTYSVIVFARFFVIRWIPSSTWNNAHPTQNFLCHEIANRHKTFCYVVTYS